MRLNRNQEESDIQIVILLIRDILLDHSKLLTLRNEVCQKRLYERADD